MDKNLQSIYEKKVERLIKNLAKNNMKGVFFRNREALRAYLDRTIEDGHLVSVGGAMTLFELDLIAYLRGRDIDFNDRYAKEDPTPEEYKAISRRAFYSDVYLASINAVTVDGELYNVDGTGNRVAAMLYGPDKVLLIIGMNKIVADEAEAVKRVREVTAPANCTRLNRQTPCIQHGSCVDCQVDGRICNEYVWIRKQSVKDRIEVLILPEFLGY